MSEAAVSRGKLNHIQGLRALAVLSVMVFHARLPLPGGFVGVDMFFVISGFIITVSLLGEHARAGRVSLRAFYWRRFKRLGPALVLMLAVTLLLSSVVFSPLGAQQAVWHTAVGSLLLSANGVLAEFSNYYFGPTAESNALLHVWSLSVEEQFYLVFPLLMIGLLALRRRAGKYGTALVLTVVAAFGFVSLWTLKGFLGLNPNLFPFGYYGPLNRAWEFLAGVLVAFGLRFLSRGRWVATVFGTAGLVLVVMSWLVITPTTPFPSKWTILPVAGTALLIVATMGADGLIRQAFSWHPLVRVGDWSYSLYLWHWPFVVVAGALFPFVWWATVMAAALSFLPAVASYYWIEEPFRRADDATWRAAAVRVVAVLMPIVLVLGVTHVWIYSVQEPGLASAEGRWAPRWGVNPTIDLRDENNCPWPDVAAQVNDNSGACMMPSPKPRVMLLGDSHAKHLAAGISAAQPEPSLGTIAYYSPVLFLGPKSADEIVGRVIGLGSVDTVIVGRWFGRTRDGMYPHERVNMRRLLEQLSSAGITVFVLDDVPYWPVDIYSCAWTIGPLVPGTICTGPRSYFAKQLESYSTQLDALIAGLPNVRRVNSFYAWCDEQQCRRADDDALLYTDSNHFTRIGSVRFVQALMQQDQALRRAIVGR